MTDEKLEPTEIGGAVMGFLYHLEELRWRLVKSAIAVVVMALVAFYFSDEIIRFIRKPLGDIKLYNMQVTGTLYAYLKVSLIAGVVAALPIVFYQLWMFISPGLYRHEKRMVLPLVSFSTILFLIGASFCFWVVLPMTFEFLMGFSEDTVTNTITIGSYISFVGMMLLAFGFSFELPLIAYFLARIGVLKPGMLTKGRRWAIVIILIVAAVLTPSPDVFTQLVLAVPMYILYELSIIIVRITYRRRLAREASAGA